VVAGSALNGGEGNYRGFNASSPSIGKNSHVTQTAGFEPELPEAQVFEPEVPEAQVRESREADDDLRRWRLLARIAGAIATSSEDFLALANTTARLIAEEIGDGCGVILLDLPDDPEPVVGYAHRVPERMEQVNKLRDVLGSEDFRTWGESYSETTQRAWRQQASPDLPQAMVLAEHDDDINIDHIGIAPIKHPWGATRGIVACMRDRGKPPYNDLDLNALAAAADAISLGIDLITVRTRERTLNRLWVSAFEASPTGHALLNLDGRIQGINAAGAEIVGRPVHQAVGLHWRAVADEASFDEDLADIDRMLEGGQPISRMRVIRRPDGTLRWVSRTISVVRDDFGAVQVVHLQFADMTALNESQQRAALFERLVDSSPDYIGIADVDGRLRYLNKGGRALVGLSEDFDVRTTRVHDYYDDSARPVAQPMSEWPIMSNGFVREESTIRDWRDGTNIPVSVSSFVMKDSITGEPLAIATIQRDNRERLAAQRAIADLAEQRRSLLLELVSAEQDERKRIANDVHDDSLQLLAASQLRLQLLSGHLKRGDIAAAVKASDDIADLVSNAQQRLRHLLLDLEPPNSPGRAIDEAIADTAKKFFADTATTSVVTGRLTELPPDVATVFYRAGREAVSNARQHAQAETVTVTLSEAEDAWRMEVVDDGIGIPDPLPVRPGHLGVRGMASRAAALGGTFAITRAEGGGTRVLLEIPRPARGSHPAEEAAEEAG
jgi:PAS domain S-box-containing protein